MQLCLMTLRQKKRVMSHNLLPIAKEGWKYIGSSIVLFFLLGFLDLSFLQFFSFIGILFFIFVFRNPERELVNFQDLSVVSPVDGKVISIKELKDEEYGYKIKIESSYLNVSFLRVPMNATVSCVSVKHGARLSKFSNLSNDLNEKAEIVFRDKNSNSLMVVHRLKQSFNGIDIQVINAQKVNQSFRYGLMHTGITTLYLPKNFRLNINIGQEVHAAQNLVGYFTS